MIKIMPEHLARPACVYIRQSTADQLLHNQESQRRLNWRYKRQRSMSLTPAGNTMLLIQPIGWWPANWSAAGTTRCRR